ncbi:MAG: NADPH-dependent glutamate synthase [Cyanobacteriota bacterium]
MVKDKISRQIADALDPDYRNTNFEEVEQTFTKDQVMAEASRCINCKKPKCIDGCPVHIDIPGFINAIKEDDIEKAGRVIRESSLLPSICGRVCPQERQCEATCILGIKGTPVAIGALERYVGDLTDIEDSKIIPSGHKVAIIGSGPAGITAAADLARAGHKVVMYEALHALGGVLRYGIPEFRLPRNVLDRELDTLRKIGVELNTNVIVGKSITIKDLFEDGFEAIFIGAGAGLPWFMGIPGENLNGVYSANEFLTRVNLMRANQFPEYPTPVRLGKRAMVVGGGNTAMDGARVAKRLGYEEVTIAYRRSEAEMPARKAEIEHAKEEGINFLFLHSPIEVHGKDGQVIGTTLQVMELGEPDASGRRRPVPIKGKTIYKDIDTFVVAIGTSPNPLLTKSAKAEDLPLEVDRKGYLITEEETKQTTMKGIYAGGDISPTGDSNVINAMGAGKRAAQAITEYLKTLETAKA